MRIVRTIETHTHADHVSGHGRLALEHGIPVSVHAEAGVDYPNDPMRDGDEIEVGAVALGVDPYTRPPARALLPHGVDYSRGDEPWLVLTGDSLFVGDAARPDLAVGASRAPKGSSTRCAGCSSSPTASRCSPATSPARSAARR